VNRRPRRGLPAVLTGLVLLAACVLTAIDAIEILVNQRPMLSYARLASSLHKLHWNGPAVEITAAVLIVVGLILLLAACLPGRPVVLALSDTARPGNQPLLTDPSAAGLPTSPGPTVASSTPSAIEPAAVGPLSAELSAEASATALPTSPGPAVASSTALAAEPLTPAAQLPPSGLSRHGLRTMLRATAAEVDGVTTVKLAVRRKAVAASVHSAGPPGSLADDVRGALEQRLDQIAPARRPALRVRARSRAAS
jgi:Family of unknown function (DUF6286)